MAGPESGGAAFTEPGIEYLRGSWRLEPGEALVIEGAHRYTAAEFGLVEEEVRERFAFYEEMVG